MNNLNNKSSKVKKIPVHILGICFMFVLSLLMLFSNLMNSNQAISPRAASVRFHGEYSINDGPWQPIVEGQHISSTKGDVTLKGNFHMYTPDGEYIGVMTSEVLVALYTDHISLTITDQKCNNYVIDHENPLFWPYSCGIDWTAHSFANDGTEPIIIKIHNPHHFGNETAIDELISNFAIWGNIDFEKNILESGNSQRNTGLVFVIVAFALIGTAIFSALLHLGKSRLIWLLGSAILFAGIYFIYSAPGISFWSESIVSNTIILGVSMMFYMFFITCIITHYLQKMKNIGSYVTYFLGIICCVSYIFTIVANVSFYDTWLFWTINQTIANIILVICLIKDCFAVSKKNILFYIGMIILISSFEIDAIATFLGFWKGGFISKYIFLALFIVALFIVLRIIPENINTAAKAKELEFERSRLEAEKNMIEAELKDSRISIMLSQIQPHFIYNTLGTIERMCLKDPKKAFDLVRNFSLYLRGSFSELDSVIPIRFSDEIKHVEYYVNIEKVRFPDMNIEFHLETMDFVLPALSVQPLVENAIKHGLMGLETGGTVVIHSYETELYYCVEVLDNGVGFDKNIPIDGKKHVGLRNIKGRLQAMVNGELEIDSIIGVGTKAVIKIPKEKIV